MKNILYTFIILSVAMFSCVDDWQDANPPRPLDAPAIFATPLGVDGGIASTSISISDAPGMLDSVSAMLTDYESEITITGFPEGQETGGFTISFPIDEEEFSGDLVIEVYDAQTPRQSASARVTVQCAPAPGDYRIVMHDSYGDGWQTDDANGGNGLLVVLSNGTEIEVGMCSPYLDGDYDCVDGDGTDAEDIVTIPEGGLYAEWFFPGDNYGEISFEIYSPTDELVFQYAESDVYSGKLPGFNCVR